MADEFGLIDEEYDSDVIYPVSESLVAYEELDEYDDDGSPETDDADDKVDTSSEAGFFSVLDLEVDFDSNTGVEPDDADDVMDDDVPEFDGTDDDVPEEEYVLDDNILDAPTTVNVKNGDTCIVQDIDGQPVVVGVIGGGDLMADNIAEAWQKAQEAYNKSVDSAETLIGAVNKAEQAAQDAATAKEAVAGISQYTWSDAEGTHVSTKEKTTDGAANILVNSAGIDINLDGTAHPTASFTKDGVILREYTKTDIEGETVETNKPIASFTRNGFIVGDSSNAIGALTTDGLLVGSGANKKLAATADGVVMYDSAGSPTATFNTDGIQMSVSGQPVMAIDNSNIFLGGSNTTSITMAGNACLNVSKLNIGPVYNPITSRDDLKGDKGEDGKDAVTYYTWIKYADDSSGNGLSDSPDGKKYIGFAYNKTTATESTNKSDYKWSKIAGEQGVAGAKGEDGKTYYTWIKYSDYENGYAPYDTPNSNTKYIGIATNKETKVESSTPEDYVWSKFKGEQGVQGPQGPQGERGIDVTSQYAVYDSSYGLYLTNVANSHAYYHTLITSSGIQIKNGTHTISSFNSYSNGLNVINLGKARISEYGGEILSLGLESGSCLYFSPDGTLNVGKSTSSSSNLNGGIIECNKIIAQSSITSGTSIRASTNVTADGDIIANYGANMGIGLRYDSSKWGVFSWGTSSTTSNKWLIYRAAGGTVTCGSSSKQCKENIQPVSDEEAKKLLDIGTYTFDYKEEACPLDNDGNIDTTGRKGWIGVLAEDVYEVIPRAVCNTENIDIAKTIAEGGDTSSLGVDYQTFIPYLIKMTQIQQQKIDELEGRIAALENA